MATLREAFESSVSTFGRGHVGRAATAREATKGQRLELLADGWADALHDLKRVSSEQKRAAESGDQEQAATK
jgi:hypothetical protein